MKKQTLISAVSIFILVLIAGVWAAESHAVEKLDLKLRLMPGQTYSVRHTHKVKYENDSFLYVRDIGFEVERADANGIAMIKVTYQALKMDITRESFDGGCGVKLARPILVRIQYDSTKQSLADDDPNLPVIEAAGVGESFGIKITPNGKIIGLYGLERMHTRIAERVIAWDKEHLEKKWAERLKVVRRHNTRSYYSEREIRNMLTDVFVTFPEQPLSVGDSWTDKVKIWGKNYEIEGTYTLKDNEKGIVAIDLSAERTPEEEAFSWVNNEGRTVGFKIVGSFEGRFEVEQQTGWLVRSKIKTWFTGKVIDKEAKDQMTKPILQEEVVTVELME